MIFIPGVNTVLDAIADQRVVDAHVAVAKESVSFTRSCEREGKSNADAVHRRLKKQTQTTMWKHPHADALPYYKLVIGKNLKLCFTMWAYRSYVAPLNVYIYTLNSN